VTSPRIRVRHVRRVRRFVLHCNIPIISYFNHNPRFAIPTVVHFNTSSELGMLLFFGLINDCEYVEWIHSVTAQLVAPTLASTRDCLLPDFSSLISSFTCIPSFPVLRLTCTSCLDTSTEVTALLLSRGCREVRWERRRIVVAGANVSKLKFSRYRRFRI
jgi:hypothetical protein